MNIYAIGGLGADERVFSKLNLDQEIIFIPWLIPYQKESIITYSQRLIRGYTITDRDILIGVSFGGLIAQHTSQFVKPKAIMTYLVIHHED